MQNLQFKGILLANSLLSKVYKYGLRSLKVKAKNYEVSQNPFFFVCVSIILVF